MATSKDIFEGMRIIRSYTGEKKWKSHSFQAEHDQLWCCDYNAEKMSQSDRELMNKMGWFEDEGAWSKFT